MGKNIFIINNMHPLSSKSFKNSQVKVDFKYVNVLVSRHSWKVITSPSGPWAITFQECRDTCTLTSTYFYK
jgi:hypothetical protein